MTQFKRLLGCTVFIGLLSSAALFADEKADFQQVADAFSECAALQNTMAEIILKKDAEHSQALRQAASDASIVATDMLVAGGFKKERGKQQYDTHFNRFQALLDASATRSYQAFTTEVKPTIATCAALYDIQTSLMSERRKQNYGAH